MELQKKITFSRENTKLIKGIAVLLMLAHHMFAFADRIPSGFSYSTWLYMGEHSYLSLIGSFGKICVSLFLFLGGYGWYINLSKTDRPGKLLFQKIKGLYLNYWFIFLIFVPIGFLFFQHQGLYTHDAAICTAYDHFDIKELFLNLIGWNATYNREWWFLRAYLFMILTGTLYYYLTRWCKHFWGEYLFLMLLQGILWFVLYQRIYGKTVVFTFLVDKWLLDGTSLCFLLGMVFGKYHVLEEIENHIANRNVALQIIGSIAAIILTFYARIFLPYSLFDELLVPIFIIACWTLFRHAPRCNSLLQFFGKHSNNIWLIHSFYCYYFYAIVKIVYVTPIAIIDFVILATLSLVTSIAVTILQSNLRQFQIKHKNQFRHSA